MKKYLAFPKFRFPVFRVIFAFTVAVPVLLVSILPAKVVAAATIFEDRVDRTDSSIVGNQWVEYFMRRPDQQSPERMIDQGNTPWRVKDGTIYYHEVGDHFYIEDFIQTRETFPVNNTRVEFEIRGDIGTSAGYVGPAVFWTPHASKITSYGGVSEGHGVIGVNARYRWENDGTRGLHIRANGETHDFPEAIFGGMNQQDFSRHAFTVQDNVLTYESDTFPTRSISLDNPLEAGERRHLYIGVRLYDRGVPQEVEIRNIRVISLDEDSDLQKVTPPERNEDLVAIHGFLSAFADNNYQALLNYIDGDLRRELDKETFDEVREYFLMHGSARGTVQSFNAFRLNDQDLNVELIAEYPVEGYLNTLRMEFVLSNGKITLMSGRWH